MEIQDVDLGDEYALPLSRAQQVARAIEKLPKLSLQEIPLPEDSCPICLNSFSAIHKGEIQNEGFAELSGVVSPKLIELRGVTRLEECGHVFCRVDLIEWIRGGHGTCPACRHAFADIRPITDADDESSDDDYIPDDDEEDVFTDEEAFFGGMDTDSIDWDSFRVPASGDEAEGDLELGPEEHTWEDTDIEDDDEMVNAGLSEGESPSEGEMGMVSGNEDGVVDGVEVRTTDDGYVEESSSTQDDNGSKQ
ncbi:hypothetical protein BDY19DRAFT_944485 [Irpex rosettiformis]|uniref:Uncharacterized protein n=1 Tax=Irpex rosettiformis TaxID=378272 RepID=A0ACB8U449_9APHY|nr:hypothetical protein BDY19DRAFT_944485 [Irpex rosettiformis]